MTKRNLFNSCLCALALPRLLWLCGVGVGWPASCLLSVLHTLAVAFTFPSLTNGGSLFCGGLRWWGHPSFYVRGNVYNIRCYLRYYLDISFFWQQKFRWRRFSLCDDLGNLFINMKFHIMFQRYRIVLLVRYSLTTLYRIFRHRQGHKDFAARVLTYSLSLSRAVQYCRHIENVFK